MSVAAVALDAVTQYAVDVRDGRNVQGRAVRLACLRHERDLARQRTSAFPFYFDVAAAEHVIAFFPTFLTLESGDPFILPPWLQFSYGCIYGWKCWGGDRNGLRKYQHGFFESSKGSGKALALDTPIPTPAGWSTMGALQVGDVVFDERGRPAPITLVSDVMTGHQCYEVEFDDGSIIVADAEHLWATEMRSAVRADGKIASAGVKMSERGRWKHGIRTTAEILRTLRYPNGKYRSANHSVQLANPLVTDTADVPVDPYVLGVWLGDGDSDCARLTIGDQDLELIDHVVGAGVLVGARQGPPEKTGRYSIGSAPSDICRRGHPRETESHNGRCRACERGRDKAARQGVAMSPASVVSMAAHFRTLGILNDKHIPDVFLRGDVGQRLGLLQGLMDTDGYIAPKSGECTFTSTSERLAVGVEELIVSLGIKCSRRESAAMLYGREVSRCWDVQFHPPFDLPVFRLRRKLQWQQKRHNRRRLSGERRIVDVRETPSVPVRCIAVDTPSHLFLAGRSMIPTHNTPSAGGLALYGVAYDDEGHAEIYSTGFDKGQASIILNDGIRMAKDSPDDDFRAEFEVGKYNIAHPSSGSFFRAMSSQHQSKSGPRPHYVLSDEIHEHRDGTVVSKAESGFKFRPQPLGLKYTNSGSDRTSYCWQLHQKSIQVLEGTLVDEQWFAYVCHLDPCEACFADGYRQPKDGCPDCDDWTDRRVWPKIAPALGIVIKEKYLQDAVDTAMSIPSEYAIKRRLNFCIWTETHNVWISSDRYDACRVPAVSESNSKGYAAALGLDPSSVLDLTSAVVALRIDDPPSDDPVPEVEIEGMDEHGAQVRLVYTLNFHVELIPFFWMPRATQIERVRNERIPFDSWERDRKLFTTPGPAIDHNAIYDFVIKDVWKRFKLQRIGMDENGGRFLFMKLRDEGRLGKQIVSVGQGKKLSEAFKFIEILIAHKRLRHDGHPVLAWCFANAEPQRDVRTGALWIEKPEEKKRIDGAVAAAMAISQLMALPARRKSIAVFAV